MSQRNSTSVSREKESKKSAVIPLDKIPNSNLLLANFPNSAQLLSYIQENNITPNHITYVGNRLNISKEILSNLDIVTNNEFNKFICQFWKVTEKEMYSILKKCDLTIPANLLGEKNKYYSSINKEICGIFSIVYNTENRNAINQIRFNDGTPANTEIVNIIKKRNDESRKYHYLSNFYFMKYITLFFNLKKRSLVDIKKLYEYEYYTNKIYNKENVSHIKIIQEAPKSLPNVSALIKLPIIPKEITSLYTRLKALFGDQNCDIVKMIKNMLVDKKYFPRVKYPFILFQRDLMKKKIDFDYYGSIEFFNNKLDKDIKLKYYLRYVQSRLISQYKEILENSLSELKKKSDGKKKKKGKDGEDGEDGKDGKKKEKYRKKYDKLQAVLEGKDFEEKKIERKKKCNNNENNQNDNEKKEKENDNNVDDNNQMDIDNEDAIIERKIKDIPTTNLIINEDNIKV